MTETNHDPSASHLRGVPLLVRLDEPDIHALSRVGSTRSFSAGQVIFREGDPGDAMFVVIDGLVRVGMLADSGNETTLASFGPGDCFGELALFDGLPRSGTATATRATRTFTVSRPAFRTWIGERPGAALALLETLSLRLRRTNERLADQVFLDLNHRLVKELLDRCAGRPGPVTITCTQAELGALLGVSRESVNKTLRGLERTGALALGRGRIVIDQPSVLLRAL